MALQMARPIQLKPGGSFYLKERTPSDLLASVWGQTVVLPIGDDLAKVRVGEHVQVSLRTKSKVEARERHAAADARLRDHWKVHRAGPKSLSQKQSLALAGELYRLTISEHEDNPGKPQHWLDVETKSLLARKARYHGPSLLVGAQDKHRDALLEKLYGTKVDDLLSLNGVLIDAESRTNLIRNVGTAYEQATRQLRKNAEGDYQPDPLAGRFPPWERPRSQSNAPASKLTVAKLAALWAAAKVGKLAPNTIKRYAPSHASFAKFVGDRDVAQLTDDDVYAWALYRKEKEGVTARTVNQNDLVAVSSLFKWGLDRSSGKLTTSNPAEGVQIEQEEAVRTREKAFRHDEVVAILRAASAVVDDPKNPTGAFAKRWCPWLAAYSGARITELTGLHGSNIRSEDGVPVMDFVKTKTKTPRTVPLHPHLLELGFLEFAKSRGVGPLFYDRARRKTSSTTDQAELRSRKLAAWIREATALDMAVKANHGWRHTWKTIALEVGIEPSLRDAITGHVEKSVGRSYEHKSIKTLDRAMKLFPRYNIK